jgi:uncharacterized protein (DUF427 family)
MAQSMTDLLNDALPQLRYVTTPKRVRVRLGGHPVADSARAALVWEPRRIVPSYAVPREDIVADLVDAETGPAPAYRSISFGADGPKVLDPSVPFAVHTAAGRPLSVRAGGVEAVGAAFGLDDPDVSGYVVLDFPPFDWWEEDQPLVGHPRDPLHRIDVCPSSRTIRIEHRGIVLAETDEARLLFEGTFPMPRYYLPRSALRVPVVPGERRTTCAYKGQASHWTVETDGLRLPDIAWSYEQPEHDGEPVRGRISFYTERLDVFVDGEPVDRVHTPWSDDD